MLVRIDGASDMLPVVPYCGLLLVSRRRQAVPLLAGVVTGAIFGAVDGLVLSRPYLISIKSSLIPLAEVGVLVTVLTAIAVVVLRRHSLPEAWQRRLRGNWLLNAASAVTVLIAGGFAVRPYFQTTHGQMTQNTQDVIAGFQRADHLPVDPTRLYYEISLHWVFWYIGLPAVILGTLGAAILVRRCLRGSAPAWTLPLLIFGWTIVTTLYRPAITPDQPWASRRLVPAVLPGFILLAVWALAWLKGWLRQHDLDRVTCGGIAAVGAVALLLPTAMTTYGLGVKDGGPLGVRPTLHGLGTATTYAGEIAAVSGMCAAIPRNASVVIVDGPIADRFTQVVRGMCDVPVARINRPATGTVETVLQAIRAAGRQPVLFGATKAELTRFGGPPSHIMALRSTQDDHALTRPPKTVLPLNLDIWMSEPPR